MRLIMRCLKVLKHRHSNVPLFNIIMMVLICLFGFVLFTMWVTSYARFKREYMVDMNVDAKFVKTDDISTPDRY